MSIENISALSHPPPMLQGLSFLSCPKISDISYLSKQTDLVDLIIEDCGDIQSLAPIYDLKHLRYLSFSEDTTIADGHFHPLMHMPSLLIAAFDHRPHYQPSEKQFEEWHWARHRAEFPIDSNVTARVGSVNEHGATLTLLSNGGTNYYSAFLPPDDLALHGVPASGATIDARVVAHEEVKSLLGRRYGRRIVLNRSS